jgi:hypothetical protein
MSTGRLIIAKPGSLHDYCKQMEAASALLTQQVRPITKAVSATTSALTNALAEMNRAQKFIIEQYRKSPLAKKRAAKINLTNAVNAALARARKTWREVAASFLPTEQAPQLFTSSPPLLAQHFAANAPNERAPHRLNTGSTRALALER